MRLRVWFLGGEEFEDGDRTRKKLKFRLKAISGRNN